jgi:hypothetical protein
MGGGPLVHLRDHIELSVHVLDGPERAIGAVQREFGSSSLEGRQRLPNERRQAPR